MTRLDFEADEEAGRRPVRMFTGDACGRWSDRTDEGPDPGSPRVSGGTDLFDERARLYGMGPGAPALEPGQVGIPRAQQYWDLHPFLEALMSGLGLSTGISSPTTTKTIQRGIALSRTEQCMPVKVALAHVDELLDRGAGSILVPVLAETPQAPGTRNPDNERLIPCVYTLQLGAVASATLGERARSLGIPVMRPSISLLPALEDASVEEIRSSLRPLGSWSRGRVRSAFRDAVEHLGAVRRRSEAMGLEALRDATREKPVVVVFGRPYTLYDPVLNIQLSRRLERLGLIPVPYDTILAGGALHDHLGFMQWRVGSEHLRAARAVATSPHAYTMHLSYYGCGPDAFTTKYFGEILGDRPSLFVELDGHSAEAGLETRLEAFADSIRTHAGTPVRPRPPVRTLRDPEGMRGRVVALPYFADHVHAFAGALEMVGMEARIMPMPTDETRLVGERYSNGRECNPYTILLGDLVKWAKDPSVPVHRKGFFITSARGPCLLGHYAQSYVRVLDEIGAGEMKVWNPYGVDLIARMGMSMLRPLWHGLLGCDYLWRWSCALRPREVVPGSVERAKAGALELVRAGVRDGDVLPAIRRAVEIMQAVPVSDRDEAPGGPPIKVGIIGDIYTRVNPYANQDLYAILMELGCEVLAPPFMIDGQLYDMWEHPRVYWQHGMKLKAGWRGVLSLYQAEETWRVRRLFPQDPAIVYDGSGREWRARTSRYFNADVDGYFAQNIGKAMDFIDIGAEGVLNVICHNCMVGLASDAVLHELRRDHGDIPILTVAYDSLGDVHVRTRLEAFVDLLGSRRS